MKLTFSIVQFQPMLNQFSASIKRAEKFIQQAKSENSQIICFPEDFLTGALDFYSPKELTYIGEKLPTIFKEKFKKLSQKYQVTIIGGTISEKISENKIVNRSYIFDKGQIVYFYDKINLYLSEKSQIQPGSINPEVINFNGIKIGIAICKDLFYPRIFQLLAKQGAQIIFVPSLWSANNSEYLQFNHQISKYKVKFLANTVTKILGQARAIENGVFLAFVNCCGSIKKGNDFDIAMGKSFIASPLQGIISKTSYLKKEVLLTTTIELDETQDSKEILDI